MVYIYIYIFIFLCWFFLQNILALSVQDVCLSTMKPGFTLLFPTSLFFFFADTLQLRSQQSHEPGKDCEQQSTSSLYCTLQIDSMNNANASISPFLVLKVNRKITSNPII